MMENRVAESHLLQWVFTNFEVTPQARVYKEDVFDAYVNVCVDAGTTPLAIDIFKRILQKVIPDARVFKRERKPSRTTKKNAAWSMRYIGNGSEFFEKSQTPSCDIMQDVVRSLTVLKPRDVFVSSTTEKRIRLCMFTEFLLDGLHVRKELTVYKTGRVKLVCGEKKLNPDDIGIPSRISKWRDLYLVTFFRFAVCQGYDSSEDSPGAVGLIHDMINHAAPVFYRMYSKACPGYLTYANDEDICDECFTESTKEPKEEQIPGQSTGEQLKSDKRNDDEDDEDDENDDMPGPSTSENHNLVPPIIIKYNPLLKVEVRKIPETRSMDDSDSENEQEPQKEKALDLRQNIHGPKQIIQNSKQTVLDVKQTIQTSEKTVHDPQQTIQDAKQTVHDPNQNVQEENTAAPDQPMDDVSDLDNDDFDDDPDSEIESGGQNLESVIDHIMEDCSNILQDEPSAVYLSAKKQDTQHSSQDFTKSTSEAISYKDTADPSPDIPIISNVTSLSTAEPVITRQPPNSTSLQAPVPVQPDPVSCESSATAAPAQKYTSAWYNVRQNENGSITFEYTPDLFGLHEVFLRINGELAKVAPFACMVTEDVGGNRYQYTPKWNIAVQAGTVQCSLVEAPAVPLPAADKSTPVSEEVPVIKQEPQSDDDVTSWNENNWLTTAEPMPNKETLPTDFSEAQMHSCESKSSPRISHSSSRQVNDSHGFSSGKNGLKSNRELKNLQSSCFPEPVTTRRRSGRNTGSSLPEPESVSHAEVSVYSKHSNGMKSNTSLNDAALLKKAGFDNRSLIIKLRRLPEIAHSKSGSAQWWLEQTNNVPAGVISGKKKQMDPYKSGIVSKGNKLDANRIDKMESANLNPNEESDDVDYDTDQSDYYPEKFTKKKLKRKTKYTNDHDYSDGSGSDSAGDYNDDGDFANSSGSEGNEYSNHDIEICSDNEAGTTKVVTKLDQETVLTRLKELFEMEKKSQLYGDMTLEQWFPKKFLPKPDPVDTQSGEKRKKWQRKPRYFCQAEGCDMGFSNIDIYKRHCKTHPKTKQLYHLCDICGQNFKTSTILRNHRLRHSESRPYVCKVPGCNKSFKTNGCLAGHNRIHKEKHHLCQLCGNKFSRKQHYIRHLKFAHPSDDNPIEYLPCPMPGCGKSFKTISSLRAHKATHVVENLECDICGIILKNRSSLLKHTGRCIIKRKKLGLYTEEAYNESDLIIDEQHHDPSYMVDGVLDFSLSNKFNG